MNNKKAAKGQLAILESLYGTYKSHLDDGEVLQSINTIAWELTFALGHDGVFHSLAESVQGYIYQGIKPDGGHYIEDIEETLAEWRKDPANYYE